MLTADTLRAIVEEHESDDADSDPDASEWTPTAAGLHTHRAALLAFVRGVADVDPARTSYRYGDPYIACVFCEGEDYPAKGKSIKAGDLYHAESCLWLVAQGAKESP